MLFESPRRLAATLDDLAEALGPYRPVAVARELTKVFETVWRGTLAEAAEEAVGPEPRGEQVIVVGPPPTPLHPVEPDDELIHAALRVELEAGATVRDAAGAVAVQLGLSRRRVYALATSLRGSI